MDAVTHISKFPLFFVNYKSININLIEQLKASSGFSAIKADEDVTSLKDLLVQFIENNDKQL